MQDDARRCETIERTRRRSHYNTYNPAPFAGKTGNVRDCIEGHPAAVFFTNTSDAAVSIGARTVAAGETVLYFAGNMNNSKKNFEVFGWDSAKWPEQCCVEVLNNIDLQCRFRSDDLSTETWDGAEGTSSFEFAFPKNPTAAMKENFSNMLSWVVSTATDLATGNALATPVILNGTTYANDTAAYRAAKFLAEFDNYFVRDQMLFHFLFTERHCMADNRSKNVFFCYDYYEDVGGYRWSVRRNYDNDTAEGCDNSGGATFGYGLELNDKVGDSYVFNANDNTIWVNIDALMQDELLRVYKANKDAWDAARIIKKFNDYQAPTPEALRSEDMWNKFFQPLLLKGDGTFKKRCHGPKEYWREQFEYNQEIYMNSKYYFGQYVETMTRAKSARNAPAGGTLQDYIDHPALFEAYPHLRNVTLRFERMGGGNMGYYDRQRNEIVLNTELRYAAEDTLVHEIQHAIQKAEGFTRGSNEEYWKRRQDSDDAVHVYDAKIQDTQKRVDEIMSQLPENVAEQFRRWSSLDESSQEAMMLMQELGEGPYL